MLCCSKTVPVSEPHALIRLLSIGRNGLSRSSANFGSFEDTAAGEHVEASFSPVIFAELSTANQTRTDMAASVPLMQLSVAVDDEAETAAGLAVSGRYFTVLRIHGRNLVHGHRLSGRSFCRNRSLRGDGLF